MSLPKSLTTVTSFSKIFAGILFILFPLVGFRFGMLYQKSADIISNDESAQSERKIVLSPTSIPTPILSPNKSGWYRYISSNFDYYFDYPNTYSLGSDGSLEKKVNYPHRTSSWIFINNGLFSNAQLDILNRMSFGETIVIRKDEDTIPKEFNTYERLQDVFFGTKKIKSFVNKNVWEGDHLYVYIYEGQGKVLHTFGGFTTEGNDAEDNISYSELKEVISTLRFLD